jgi:FtsH-binding integral membrane protein
MINEKLNLWYCDNFVQQPWQFFLLIVPLVGAYFYGREKHKLAWTLIGAWLFVQLLFVTLTNLVFTCTLGDS